MLCNVYPNLSGHLAQRRALPRAIALSARRPPEAARRTCPWPLQMRRFRTDLLDFWTLHTGPRATGSSKRPIHGEQSGLVAWPLVGNRRIGTSTAARTRNLPAGRPRSAAINAHQRCCGPHRSSSNGDHQYYVVCGFGRPSGGIGETPIRRCHGSCRETPPTARISCRNRAP
jgi:hypothetical protein